MSRFLLTLPLLLLGPVLAGQITIDSDYFPAAGDSLKYSVAPDGVNPDLLTPGADRQWDFGTIEASRELTLAATSATDDTLFVNADLALDIDTITKGYYSVTDNSFDLVGIRGGTALLEGYTLEAVLNPARPDRRAPLAYGDSFQSETENVIVVAVDDLPQEALDQFGSVISGVDSIRLTTNSVRQDDVDAHGLLTLNGQAYDVLRETRVETLTTKVEAKIIPLDYVDITSGLATLVPEFAGLLGEQEPVTTYYFWADGFKEAIATVTRENDGSISRMTFIRGDATNSTGGPFLRQADIRIYPNPAHGLTTFEVQGLDAGEYDLRVLNILGKRVARHRFSPVSGEAKVPVDLGHLPRGTYLFSLINERGRILTTRRMVVGG